MPRRAPSMKRVETVGVLGALSAPVHVLLLVFLLFRFFLLSLFQQTSRISLLMDSLTIYSLSICPVWDTWVHIACASVG